MTKGIEKRGFTRDAADMRFDYSVTILEYGDLRKVLTQGEAVDMSAAGMGFITDFPLEAGHVVKIDAEEIHNRPFMVKWVREASGRYRVGGVFL